MVLFIIYYYFFPLAVLNLRRASNKLHQNFGHAPTWCIHVVCPYAHDELYYFIRKTEPLSRTKNESAMLENGL